MSNLFFYAVKVYVTNLLSHRYLWTKAKTMVAWSSNGNAGMRRESKWMEAALDGLQGSLKWEIRMLWVAPIGVVFYYTGFETVGSSIGVIATVLMFLMDGVFSVTSVMIFLRPCFSIMKLTATGAKESITNRRMRCNAYAEYYIANISPGTSLQTHRTL